MPLQRRQAGDQAARHGVGVAGVGEPQPVGEIGIELRGQQPHLREQVAAALAPELELARRRASKKITTSAPSAPFLVAPRLSTSTPAFHESSAGEQPTNDSALAKRAPSMCSFRPWRRVAVRDRGDVLRRIDGAAFGRLGEADTAEAAGDGPRRRPAGPAPRRASCGRSCRPAPSIGTSLAPRVELRRVRLVDGDVRGGMAEDRAPRRRAAGERQHVGGGAGGDRIGHQVGLLEDVAQALLDLPGPLVGAVGMDGTGAEGAAHCVDDQPDGRRPRCRCGSSSTGGSGREIDGAEQGAVAGIDDIGGGLPVGGLDVHGEAVGDRARSRRPARPRAGRSSR